MNTTNIALKYVPQIRLEYIARIRLEKYTIDIIRLFQVNNNFMYETGPLRKANDI